MIFGRLGVAEPLGDQHLAPDDPGVGNPAGGRDGDVDGRRAGAEREHDRDHQHVERETR